MSDEKKFLRCYFAACSIQYICKIEIICFIEICLADIVSDIADAGNMGGIEKVLIIYALALIRATYSIMEYH